LRAGEDFQVRTLACTTVWVECSPQGCTLCPTVPFEHWMLNGCTGVTRVVWAQVTQCVVLPTTPPLVRPTPQLMARAARAHTDTAPGMVYLCLLTDEAGMW
jgi:hypothetical protein